jgi:hypothetical protein
MQKSIYNVEQNWNLISVIVICVVCTLLFSLLRKISRPSQEDILLMSADELKMYKGFENMNEKEAKEYIYTMQQYCMITFALYRKEKNIFNEK